MTDKFPENHSLLLKFYKNNPELIKSCPKKNPRLNYIINITKTLDQLKIPIFDTPLTKMEEIRKHVYEGGFKIWECEKDAVEFMFEDSSVQSRIKNSNILELGCGSGLVGELTRNRCFNSSS